MRLNRGCFASLFLGVTLLPVDSASAQVAPGTTVEMAAAAAEVPPALAEGPVKATWESVGENYRPPEWFRDAKFGIFMHWGLYAVPAHGSEWYVKYMYGNPGFTQWHTEHFGPPDRFGYKDFIPLFTAAKWDPDAWATLFKKAGARYVVPTAEHHDGWANWDSDLTQWCAGKMGPKRDLIGDLGKAVRAQGLKFGVSSHRMNHYDFIRATPGLATDLLEPKNDDFYWAANHSEKRYIEFMSDWVARSCELIDKYQPDMLWYDMGGGNRVQDPIKTKVAAYYYNRAKEWKKEVSLSAKGAAFVTGSLMDYEREGRAPMEITDYPWQADDPIGNKFGYVEGMELAKASTLLERLIENTSKNGNLLLNISPRADGTIPDEQQQILLEMGRWLEINGEAIYATRPWTRYGEGPAAEAAAETMQETRAKGFAGRINEQNVSSAAVSGGGLPKHGYSPKDIRFTRKGNSLYAILMAWPGESATIASLSVGNPVMGKVEKVELLGRPGTLAFSEGADGLKVTMPAEKPCDVAFALKITGLLLD